MKRRCVVIGGGLGGLATALRLSARNWHVTVCEAGSTFGGKMNRWQEAGYTFDTGPSLITMPWVFADLFATVGSRIDEHVTLVPLQPLSEYVYADGTRFHYSSSLPDWLGTLARIAPEDEDGFLRFLRLGSRIFEVSKHTFLKRTPFEKPSFRDGKLLRNFPFRRAWGNYNRTVNAYFRSPYLRQLFNRYPTYVGSSPYASPATLAIIPYIEFAFGGWYVLGGLYRIVEALLTLCAAAGVELRTGARVERIERSNGRATGVRLASGERIDSEIIVMNGDAATTAGLLEPGGTGRPRSRSLSGFVMLLGIDCPLPQMAAHTIYFSADYKREFDQLFQGRVFPDDPTVYVNVPSRLDRSLAPPSSETLFIMANAPAISEPWGPKLAEAKNRVFQRLRASGFPDVSKNIRVEDIWTPERIEERYLMPGGAIYGADSHGWRNAFLRPPNKSRACRGLYHVGGSTHPGGGTPTVLLSAEITCALIEKYERG